MKIKIVFDIDKESREAIADQFGESGPADYETTKSYLRSQALGALEEVSFDYWQHKESEGTGV